jgi:predicted RNase H-like nuclease (RuvC/YqgF family)
MSKSKAVGEKIKRLRNERRNLVHEIEEVKKQADSEATALESEVSMLREELSTEELNKLNDSEATALESKISMLREDLILLRMDLPPYEPEEKADPNKKPWWHFFR